MSKSNVNFKITLKSSTYKPNFISIKKKSKCLFCRKNGYIGTIIFGYSVILRIFGKTIL